MGVGEEVEEQVDKWVEQGLLGNTRIQSRDGRVLSVQEFASNYMEPNIPVVIHGACEGWRSLEDWAVSDTGAPDIDFIRRNFGNSKVCISKCGSCEVYDSTVQDYLNGPWLEAGAENLGEPRPIMYLKDWHFVRDNPSYGAYTVPCHFAEDWMNLYWDYKGNDDFRFVYMGPRGSWTPLHHDVFFSYSWSVNVVGTKLWILFPPEVARYLKNSRGELCASVLTCSAGSYPDLRLALKAAIVVKQEAGDAIFVPSGWHHQVHNLEPTISINHNWCNGFNIEAVWGHIKEESWRARDMLAGFAFEDPTAASNGLRLENALGGHAANSVDIDACESLMNAQTGLNLSGFRDFVEFMVGYLTRCSTFSVDGNVVPSSYKFQSISKLRRILAELSSMGFPPSESVATILMKEELERPFQTRKEAYITLVTSDDFVVGAEVLAYSLQLVQASRPLVVMVTEAVNEASRQRLRESGYHVTVVPPLPNPNADVHVPQWMEVGFTKLRLWDLEAAFSKLVYIDADCIVVDNCDELFHLGVDFAAAPDIFPPDHFNAGVMVVVPSSQLFARMLRAMASTPSYDGGDTGFLNKFFPDWFRSDPCSRLPFGYNALRVMQWYTKKRPQYWQAVKPLKVIHFCSSPKPWEDSVLRRGGPLEQQWWQLYDAMPSKPLTCVSNASEMKFMAPEPLTCTISPYFSPAATVGANMSQWNVKCLPSFTDSMGSRPLKFGVWSTNDDKWLERLRDSYSAVCGTFSECNSAHPGIPKLIHQIWLGGECPARFNEWRLSWSRHHPRWEYKLWKDEDLKDFPFSKGVHTDHLVRLMTNASTPVEKSDVLRLDLLLAFGGLYVDTDFECVRPFDLLHSLFGCYAGISATGTIEINNGLIGCTPSHPLIAACVGSMRLSSTPVPSAKHIIDRTGPGHFTREFMRHLETKSPGSSLPPTIALPASFFYPLPNNMRALPLDTNDRSLFLRPESFAMHHWACSWQTTPQESACPPKPSEANYSIPVDSSPNATAGSRGNRGTNRKGISADAFAAVLSIVQANQKIAPFT